MAREHEDRLAGGLAGLPGVAQGAGMNPDYGRCLACNKPIPDYETDDFLNTVCLSEGSILFAGLVDVPGPVAWCDDVCFKPWFDQQYLQRLTVEPSG